MADKWMIKGSEYGNCNCNFGCPCQFASPTTHGHCEAMVGGIIEEGYFNDTRLDGLRWVLLVQWPGEIAAGSGKQQAIIEERATPEKREAVRKILHGESTAPGATHFFVYNSTMSEVLETLYQPVTVEIDVEARRGRVEVPGLVESTGSPIIHPVTGNEHRARINLPDGFEYTVAEMGSGSSKTQDPVSLEFSDSYAQFNELHVNQDGVVR